MSWTVTITYQSHPGAPQQPAYNMTIPANPSPSPTPLHLQLFPPLNSEQQSNQPPVQYQNAYIVQNTYKTTKNYNTGNTPTDSSSSKQDPQPEVKQSQSKIALEDSKKVALEENELQRNLNKPELQKQQVVQKESKDLKKQVKQKQLQILAADTYCRLLAQIEAIFKKLKIPVTARYDAFDLNPPTAGLPDLMISVEGLLTSLVIYNRAVEITQLDPFKYPSDQASIADFKRGLKQLDAKPSAAKSLLTCAIHCLENNAFKAGLPQEISEAIMKDAEMSQLS